MAWVSVNIYNTTFIFNKINQFFYFIIIIFLCFIPFLGAAKKPHESKIRKGSEYLPETGNSCIPESLTIEP